MEIFIVTGQTGEYSDRVEWLVKAFRDRAKAMNFIAKAEDWLRANKLSFQNIDGRRLVDHPMPDFDPDFRCDYTGTRYCIDWVDLED